MKKSFLLLLGVFVILTGVAHPQDNNAPKKETPTEGEKKAAQTETTFYDIKVTSNRFIFVIDVSGSMLAAPDGGLAMPTVNRPDLGSLSKPGAKPSLPSIKEGNNSKLAVAKRELISVINSVSENVAFNIVVFHHD